MKNIRRYCSQLFSKRIKGLLLAMIVALSSIFSMGCGGMGNSETITSIKIGVAIYDQYDMFMAAMMDRISEDFTKLGEENGISINIEIAYSSNNQSTQNTQVKNMIAHGCDVICVNPVDRTDTAYIINLAQENDLPIVFFNREPVNEDLRRWDKLYYVGADAVQSGIMEGELVVEYCKGHPEVDVNGDGVIQYLVLEGEAGHQDAIMRTEYSVSTVEDAGITLERVTHCIANWSGDQAKAKLLAILAAGEGPEIIISNNDAMALGAMGAYEEVGTPKDEWPAIFGIDGIDQGLESISAGTMKATVYNDKEGQADAIAGLAYALVVGDSLESFELEDGKYIWLPYKKVSLDNIAEFK